MFCTRLMSFTYITRTNIRTYCKTINKIPLKGLYISCVNTDLASHHYKISYFEFERD